MAVLDNIDTNAIIKGIQGMATQDSSGGVLGGSVGAVLLGALLPRLLGTGLGVDAAVAAKTLDANDVQNIIAANTNSQTLGTLKGEIWQAEGQVQNAISQASNTSNVTTLQAEIANLQGQGVINTNIAATGSALKDTIWNTGDALQNQMNSGFDATHQSVVDNGKDTLAGVNLVNTNLLTQGNLLTTQILNSKFEMAQVVTNDGEKTRAAIAALKDSIPNARELDLQRQLTVAMDDDRHNRLIGHVNSGNTIVTTNVNQAQAQAQQQQQLQLLSTNMALLGVQQQHATNLAINTGGNQRFNGSATNVAGV